jgi:hypothetical protein
MLLTRTEIDQTRLRLRRRVLRRKVGSHCFTAACRCIYCTSAHALQVYGRMLDLLAVHGVVGETPTFDERAWLGRISRMMEIE